MIDSKHPDLSVVRQCELVSISRSSFYYQPVGETAENLALMRLIDAQFLEIPALPSTCCAGETFGSSALVWLAPNARHLRRDGYEVGRKRVRRLMATTGRKQRRFRRRSRGNAAGGWWRSTSGRARRSRTVTTRSGHICCGA